MTTNFIIRLIISGMLGILIGYERTNKNKDAGIRTHAIVAISSCLMMIISKYGFSDVDKYDASRVASQIISGIGFLGAGIIFVKNNNVVSGLTTSAGIWATAGVGMAIGAGMIKVGIFVSLLLLFLQIFTHINTFINRKEGHRYKIFLKLRSGSMVEFPDIKVDLLNKKLIIENVNILKRENMIDVEIDVISKGNLDRLTIIEDILGYSSVLSINIE